MEVNDIRYEKITDYFSSSLFYMAERGRPLVYAYQRYYWQEKIRRRKTKEELLDFIVHHYRELEEKVYIIDIFEEWSNKKLSYGEISKQSYDKYCSEFKRFFTPDKKICKKQVKYITELDLEDFIKSTIHDMGLTRKAL